MGSFAPTLEQTAAVDAFTSGGDMVLEAGAGSGKTSTLKLLAAAKPNERGIYLAYNAAVAKEAKATFPQSVRAMTAHSMGYQWQAQQWGRGALQARLNAPRKPAYQTAKQLGANRPVVLSENKVIQPNQLTRIAMETVQRFCWSADTEVTKWHVPQVNGAEDAGDRAALVAAVLPMARRVWVDFTNPNGTLRYTHDAYLKSFSLTNPVIDCDYLLLDEWQDANPIVAGLIEKQGHVVRVAVGDSAQAIYGWRGSTDALSTMPRDHHLFLSQSFRFGQPVADEANKWLTLLDAPLRLTGAPAEVQQSTLASLTAPDAVLCRTNAEAVTRLMDFHVKGQPVALVGGGREIKSLAEAAEQLKTTGSTWHPELCAFTSWSQVQDYVEEDAAGGDLKVAVKLIDEHGADTIIDAINRAVPESTRGAVTVSTAHKAKGREWDKVQIASDFKEPVPDEFGDVDLPAREEMMLAYVAVTRAKQVLDRTGLAWVDNYLGDGVRADRARKPATGAPVLDGREQFRRARAAGGLSALTVNG